MSWKILDTVICRIQDVNITVLPHLESVVIIIIITIIVVVVVVVVVVSVVVRIDPSWIKAIQAIKRFLACA
jgi:hypothetical protein